LAKKIGIEVQERSVDRTELYICDEAFLCGSAMEITPLLSIDRYVVNGGEVGSITNELHKAYLEVAVGRFEEWVTLIY